MLLSCVTSLNNSVNYSEITSLHNVNTEEDAILKLDETQRQAPVIFACSPIYLFALFYTRKVIYLFKMRGSWL